MDLYKSLTREELQRIHCTLYGHRSSLQEATVAHAVSLKASTTRSRPKRSERDAHPPPGRHTKCLAPPLGTHRPKAHRSMSAAVWSRLTAPPQTLSSELLVWAKQMGAEVSFPMQCAETRKAFLRQPLNTSVQALWERCCEKGDVRVLSELRACVVNRSLARVGAGTNINRKACWCTTDGAKSRETDVEDDDAPVDGLSSVRDAKLNAALAHWKLNRVIEQGGSYLYHVCPGSKNRASALASDLGGTFVIPDATFIADYIAEVRRHRSKLRLIQTLRHANVADGDLGQEDQVADDGGDDDEDYGKEAAEYLDTRNRESTDLFPFPTIEVSLKENNLLALKVHMSDAQVRFLLRGCKEDDAGSRSAYAFQSEAVCLGEDCWLIITGMWKKKVVWVLRDVQNSAMVDSLIIGGVCWEKRRCDDASKPTDPFQCTKCGNVRKSDNCTYSSCNSTMIRKGKYRCLICGIDTFHISLVTDVLRPRPRWDPTSGNPLAVDCCTSSREVEAPPSGPQTKKKLGAPGSDRL